MSSQRVQELLAEAMELPEAQHAAFLDAACTGDPKLRAEVTSLLNALRRAGGFMAEPTGVLGGALGPELAYAQAAADAITVQSASSEQEGQMIGRYKLLQPIGEGGFGTVWMAEQREPVKRRVALKIIKLGMDTKQVILRFEAERQALAMMDHPNIAKVLDAGATETGRPYFVMEYIRGVPILEYCDTERLSTRARLELFANICNAIQHAHQKGIIHRDIKPSNVMVTMHDGVPVPKVIDFGIAKATNCELTSRTLFTEHRQLIGTPAYMSPEQAEMSGLDIDTRSDIYSLGVLLYELLTGTTPFDTKSLLEGGFAEMMRIIREVEPHKPSTRLSSLGEIGTRTAQQRQATDPEKLGGTLKGDLDWIVMKCLEKDRTRRYETASNLAADIKRHLCDEPVLAGAPSAAYRLTKFARRHRVAVAAGALVTTTLVLGTVGTTIGMISAGRAQARAEAAQASAILAAQAEAQARAASDQNAALASAAARDAQQAQKQEAAARLRAQNITDFVTRALRSGDVENLAEFSGAGQDMTVVAAMDKAVQDIRAGVFKDDPASEASLLATIAQIYRGNNRAAEALTLATRAVELQRRLHAQDSPELAQAIELLGLIHDQMGNYPEADALLTESLAMRRRLHTGDDPSLTGAIQYLGALRLEQGRAKEACELDAEALERSRRFHAGDHTEVAICLNNLALAQQALGQFVEAEKLLAESLAMHQRLFVGDHPQIAAGLNNLGLARAHLGRPAEAEPLFVAAVEMRERLYKGSHPSLGGSLANLGAIRLELARPAEAEPLVRRAVAMLKSTVGPVHVQVADALQCHGRVLMALERTQEAGSVLAEALAILERVEPGDNDRTLQCMRALATALRMNHRDAEAADLSRRSEDMAERLAARAPADSPEARAIRATQHWMRGELDQSVPMFERLVAEALATLGPDHPQTRLMSANLGVNYKDAGRIPEALRLLEPAQVASATDPALEFVTLHLLDAYSKEEGQQHAARVRELVGTYIASARDKFGPGRPELAARLSQAAQCLLQLSDWSAAEQLAREALSIRVKVQPDTWSTFSTQSVLGGALVGLNRLKEAEPLLLEGLRGMQSRESTIPIQGKPRIPEAMARLQRLCEAKGDLDQAAYWREERANLLKPVPGN